MCVLKVNFINLFSYIFSLKRVFFLCGIKQITILELPLEFVRIHNNNEFKNCS